MIMKKEEMIEIINLCWDAVSESKAGPIKSNNEDGTEVLRNLGYGVFSTLISNIIPKNLGHLDAKMTVKEPGEDWKECNH